MKPRIVSVGTNGYIGTWLGYPAAFTQRVDVAEAAEVENALDRLEEKPDVLVNCTGITGRPNIDWCEKHQTETWAVNVKGAVNLMFACLKRNIRFVQIGSGCIYEGDNGGKGWGDSDLPNYEGSYYSKTKRECEQAMRGYPVLLVRPRMPFDVSRHPRNLISKLEGYKRLLTAANSMTCMPQFVKVLRALIERNVTGTVNVVNPGSISPYEVMQIWKNEFPEHPAFEALAPEQMSEVATTGRSSCVLRTDRLAELGLSGMLTDVREAVQEACRVRAAAWYAESCRKKV